MKAIESGGGSLTNHEKKVLEGLEKEIRAVRKARESFGNTTSAKYDTGSRKDRDNRNHLDKEGGISSSLGKRRRKDDVESSEDSDVPEDVKRIPMPRDTPPPIPKEELDKWYQKRRERMDPGYKPKKTNANLTPLGNSDRRIAASEEKSSEESLETKPTVVAQTVYEAKPVIRDLRKEAVKFVPTAVRAKLDKSKGVGSLVEPEEADKLENEGYISKAKNPHVG